MPNQQQQNEAPEISTAFAGVSREIVPRAASAMEVHGAAAIAIGTAARVEAEGKMLLARQFPRDVERVEQRLLADCSRPSFAKTARFARPVGGDCEACEGAKVLDGKPCRECNGTGKKLARGLSVHFARTAFAAMGNLDVRTMLLYEGEDESVVRCAATDLETNAHMSFDVKVSKIVQRRRLRRGQKAVGTRTNSWGDTVYLVVADEADHEKDRAAAAAKKMRDAILALIPQDIKEACEAQVEATLLRALSDDRQKTVAQMISAFAKLKTPVAEADLAAYLGHAVADITDDEYSELQAIWNGVREGACSWTEVVADRRGDLERDANGKTLVDTLKDSLDKKRKPKAPDAPAAPATPAPVAAAPAKPEAPAEPTPEAPKPEPVTATPAAIAEQTPGGAVASALGAAAQTAPAPAAPQSAPMEPLGTAPARCAGGGVRVTLNETDRKARKTRCPTCGKGLGVRVAENGEATIPNHAAQQQAALGVEPAPAPVAPASEAPAPRERQPGEDDDA